MKYSPTGWAAEYKDKEDEPSYLRVVEKWGVEGQPLVVDAKVGKLVPAAELGGFLELVPLTRAVTVVSAAPGWRVNAEAVGTMEPFTAPIAAWVMDGEGTFWPVIAAGLDDGGSITKPDPRGEMWLQPVSSTRLRIVPPQAP